jgi:hypothetical protein
MRESFGRNERRKRRGYRLEQQDREIQRTQTEPDEHDYLWEDSHETVQIEREVRRRGCRGMMMSTVGSLHFIDTISVYEAHHHGHGEQTRYQSREYLPGFGGKRNQHGHYTPTVTALLWLWPLLLGR